MGKFTIDIVFILCLTTFARCQEYRVEYLCDFENGDCGLTIEPNTGASFRHQQLEVAQRKTHALVLDTLHPLGNWSFGRTRSAVIWTPAVVPSTFFSPVAVSLDLFFDAGDCLQFLLIGQQVGETTETLEIINESSASSWKTLSLNLLNPKQPIKLKVEARLLPNCQDYYSCSCAGRAAVDNLRIRTAESPEPESEPEPNDQDNLIPSPTRSVDRRSLPDAGSPAESERQVEVVSNVESRLEAQNQAVAPPGYGYPQYTHHWAHKWKFMGKGGNQWNRCPEPPRCDVVVVHLDHCPVERKRDCIYVNQAPCCHCPAPVHVLCPRVGCPQVLPCDPPPTCPPVPPYPPFPDPKTWDPKSHYP